LVSDSATDFKLDISATEVAADLAAGRGPGSDFLGWLDLPVAVDEGQFAALEAAAARAEVDTEVYVVIGIGGSYLGARAVLDALGAGAAGGSGSGAAAVSGRGDPPAVLFAGNGLCSTALHHHLQQLRGRDFRLCVISKSGTTLEPALAFRLLRSLLHERYGRQEAARRITAVTDAEKGALRAMAAQEGYETFVIPDDVGGRFSVLTPVGLLPLAVAGVDIRSLVDGAAAMRETCLTAELRDNPAHLYAATRHALYNKGFTTEILSSFHSGLQKFQEWWKQLFGESEGKEGKGIFPASTVFTTDLHSLGQYIQDGRRELMETFLCVREGDPSITVPGENGASGGVDGAAGGTDDTAGGVDGTAGGGESGKAPAGDGLDYLVGRSLDEINWKAFAGTRKAHVAGGVPCLSIEIDRVTPHTMGELIFMFEKAVAVSGRLLGVNPFDQPGVEAYKQEMFNLLGKP
jgi:glucose-6-phosphate isomerase